MLNFKSDEKCIQNGEKQIPRNRILRYLTKKYDLTVVSK